MVSKWLWMVLVAFMLGGWCDGCWEQERTALLQLKPFFNHIWEERKQSSNCCEWKMVECNTSTGRVMRLFLNQTTTLAHNDLLDYGYTWSDDWYVSNRRSYNWYLYDRRSYDWYLNASLFLPFEELKSLYLSGNSIAGCVYNEGFERLSSKLYKLEILDLSDNNFNDGILTSLSELSSLKSLNLADNQFIGSNSVYGIKRLSKLNNLEVLDLSHNMLGNNILSHLHDFTSLKSLRLQQCGLKATVDMLEFNNLKNLKELYLGENEIEKLGSLFQSKEQLKLIKLEVLGLSYNLFNNSIFSSLAALSNLKSLFIGGNELKGAIRIEELNALSNLKELDMSNNEVNDFVPSQDNETELRLINLEVLDLNGNLFNTSILPSLGKLSKLKSLSLEGNKLVGSIDLTVINSLTNLEELHISCSAHEGLRSTKCSLHPKSLGELPSSLKTLHLGGFSINGTTTTQKLHNFRNLERLSLVSSFLQNFPQTFGELTSLKSLELFDCWINNTGSLTPPELHNLRNLGALILDSSFLQSNFLGFFGELASLKSLELFGSEINNVGSLTPQGPLRLKNLESLIIWDTPLENNFFQKIGAMPSLKFLKLWFNEYNGTEHIQGFCEYTNLQELEINGYNVKGNLPECFSNLTFLRELDLSNNQFSGNISALGSLTSLEILDLSSNQFSGNISALESLTSLEILYLSSNQFSGIISALESLTSLEILDLSSNQFSGNISALESLTSLEILYLSSNQFSGNISALESLTSLELLDISNNYFQIPSSLGPLFNLSKLKSILADNNTIYAETETHFLAPSFQLNEILLSCCGDIGSFPQFLYHQNELQFVDLSNIYFKGEQYPNWLLKNNTKLYRLILANTSLSGSFQLPLPSHLGLSDLDISNNFINGSIPVEIGEQLPSLWFLNMSKNNFSGSIPSSFNDMSSLSSLDLSKNSLQGKIFSGNFSLRNLWALHLDGNYFAGRIPDFLSNSSFLSALDVSNNQLSGRIPRWMGNMSSLEIIIMSNNHLDGTIPVEFCQLDLTLLDLSDNNITGSLPSCFGPSQIRQVLLSKNRLRGTLSGALRNSSLLFTLDVSYNFLTGTIPSWIGGLSNLSHLLLNNNKFEGRIPIELCNLSNLSLINLSHNNLSGRIPPCLKITTLEDVSEVYVQSSFDLNRSAAFFSEPIEFTTKNVSYSYQGNMLHYLSGIDLSWNNLIGEIPNEFGNFRNIIVLSLSHNNLTGPIPPTFANLMQMESLDLSYNILSGNIPPEFAVLHFLSYFNVSYNNLSGKTPERIGQLGTFDESSYLGNPFLCGTLVQKNCSPIELPLTPKASTGNREDDGLIDVVVFYVTFIVSYIMVLLSIAAVLYINPYWRQAWLYRVEMCIDSCYYFMVDNLPREFRCGNM